MDVLSALRALVQSLPKCRVCLLLAHGQGDDSDPYCDSCSRAEGFKILYYDWAQAVRNLPPEAL